MLNGEQIREVTADGVIYIDQNDVEQFISFAQCLQNYTSKLQSPEHWKRQKDLSLKTDADWDDYVKWVKNLKTIGKRNIELKTIEFYSQPSLKFEFKKVDEWHTVVNLIHKARYRTTDMT